MRFLHYALSGEDLLSVHYYLVSLVVVIVGAAYGYRSRRAEQMARQYPWLFAKSGPLGWTTKADRLSGWAKARLIFEFT